MEVKPLVVIDCEVPPCQAEDIKNSEITDVAKRKYSCDICRYSFTVLSDLNRHKRIHSDEKPYKCEVCDYTCNRSDRLKCHKRMHSDEKPYKCDLCDYTCKRLDHLNKHKSVCKISNGSKRRKFQKYISDLDPYDQPVNDIYLDGLQCNKIVNSDEKPYKPDCKNLSGSKRDNVVYQRRKVRKYISDLDPYDQPVTDNPVDRLQGDTLVYSDEKPYKCDNSYYTWESLDDLNKFKLLCKDSSSLKRKNEDIKEYGTVDRRKNWKFISDLERYVQPFTDDASRI